jgi:hypothetical protein
MAELVTSGPGKGYYTLPGTLIREQVRDDVVMGERDLFHAYKAWQLSLSEDDELWYRYSPGPGKHIKGFNRSYLPFIDGFYYVRRNPQVKLRQQLYALETKQVPSSGNTETFNLNLRKVVVPEDWCPYHLDPCPDTMEWCRRCKQHSTGSTKGPATTAVLAVFMRWTILFLFCVLLAAIVTLAWSSR